MKSPISFVKGRMRRCPAMGAWALLALATWVSPALIRTSDAASGSIAEPALLTDYRNQLRRMLVLGQYQDLIALAAEVHFQFPDESSVDFYRTQAQLRLADAKREYPFERLRRRPLSLPEPLEPIRMEPIFRAGEEKIEATRVREKAEDRDVALAVPPPPRPLEERSPEAAAAAPAPATPADEPRSPRGSSPLLMVAGFIGLIVALAAIVAVFRRKGGSREPEPEPQPQPSAATEEPAEEGDTEFAIQDTLASEAMGAELEGVPESLEQREAPPADTSIVRDPFESLMGKEPEPAEELTETQVAPPEGEPADSAPDVASLGEQSRAEPEPVDSAPDLASLGEQSQAEPERTRATEGEIPAPLAQPPSPADEPAKEPAFDTWGHEIDQSEGNLDLPTSSGESEAHEAEADFGDVSFGEASDADELIQIPELAAEPEEPEPGHVDPPPPIEPPTGQPSESSVELSGARGESHIDFSASEYDFEEESGAGTPGPDLSAFAESQSGIDLPPARPAATDSGKEAATEEAASASESDLDDTVGAPEIDADDIVKVIGTEDDETGDQPTKPSSFNREFGEGEDAKPLGEIQEFHEGETIRVSLARVEGDETLKPGEEPGEERDSGDITATAPPSVSADPFDKEKDLGLRAFEREEWDRAVHHLSIAAALRPDAQEVKERLRKARRERRAS